MFGIGVSELVIIAFVGLLLVGGVTVAIVIATSGSGRRRDDA